MKRWNEIRHQCGWISNNVSVEVNTLFRHPETKQQQQEKSITFFFCRFLVCLRQTYTDFVIIINFVLCFCFLFMFHDILLVIKYNAVQTQFHIHKKVHDAQSSYGHLLFPTFSCINSILPLIIHSQFWLQKTVDFIFIIIMKTTWWW